MALAKRRSSATPPAQLRSESGQSAVEFGLVVPFLCVLVLALVDFGKAMNYWLDLNHVASEGARKAAVNTFATSGAYQDWIRNRLESIPTAAAISICMPEGGDIGDPVTVQVAVGYRWIPFVGSADWNIKGTATMRLEQKASYSGVGTCT